jgi:hypothetical protein
MHFDYRGITVYAASSQKLRLYIVFSHLESSAEQSIWSHDPITATPAGYHAIMV